MNPILLKPRKDTASEIVLMGRVFDAPADWEYYRTFTMRQGLSAVREALQYIEKNFDMILIEGAGSPAEVNLNETEIVNMRVAREADVPVILVADVDRGGALASIVGTLDLLNEDRDRVKGILFNKFRGDMSLFAPAVRWTEERTSIKVVGVMPWVPDIRIASEDSLSIRWGTRQKVDSEESLVLGVVRLPYISNHTDLEAFAAESDVELIEVDEHTPFHRFDAVILPGTKSTVQDMKMLQNSGLAQRLVEFYEKGGFLFGLCGGYQMLGRYIDDRHLRDNDTIREVAGLGLLPLITTFEAEKTTVRGSGWVHPCFRSSGEPKIEVKGYEIHFGETHRLRDVEMTQNTFFPLFVLNGHEEGMADSEMRAAGTYLHDVFHNDAFRAFWLNMLRKNKGLPERPKCASTNEGVYDALAAQIYEHLDMEYMTKLAGV